MSNKYPVMASLLVTQNTTGISPADPEITPSAITNVPMQKEYATIVNPVAGNIDLRFSSGLTGRYVTLDCIDMLGRIQMHRSIMVDNEMVQVPCSLRAGVYIARISEGQNVICQTLLTKY